MRRGALAIFALVLATNLSAQGLTVVYVEGDTQVRGATAWTELQIGDVVSPDATVRVQTST